MDISMAERQLGWAPRHPNVQALVATYDWYLANRSRLAEAGLTHLFRGTSVRSRC